MNHRTDIDGRHASTLAERFSYSVPDLGKRFLSALANKVKADAQADEGRKYLKLAAAGKRAAEALKRAANLIPKEDGAGMEDLAQRVGDLRYDALRDAIAGFAGQVSDALLPDAQAASTFRGAILEAAVAVDRAWELSAPKMGLNLDGTALVKMPAKHDMAASGDPESPADPKLATETPAHATRTGSRRDHVETLKLGTAECVLTTPADDPALPDIRTSVEAGYARSRDFFRTELSGATFGVSVFANAAAMERACGESLPEWVCGRYDGKTSTIMVHHPSFIASEGMAGMTCFSQIVAHEICHLFVARLGGAPSWINEGVAQFVAGQAKKGGKAALAALADDETFFLPNYDDAQPAFERGGYRASLYFFQRLHGEFGREKIFELWKGEKSEPLDDRFLRVLGSTPRELVKKYATDDVNMPPGPNTMK